MKAARLFLFLLPALVIGAGCGGSSSTAVQPTPGSSVRSLGSLGYTPGTPFQVSIEATPFSTTEYYAVEDAPPAGWSVSQVSDGGSLDSATGLVKWGPFSDAAQRTFTYTITPPEGATGQVSFTGTLSLDGTSHPTSGLAVISNAQ